jgi:hypothetical protein
MVKGEWNDSAQLLVLLPPERVLLVQSPLIFQA